MVTMEELLASQTKKLITLSRGQQVEGEIVSITDKEIILDLGAKSEGILQKRELTPEQIKDLKLGLKIKAFVSLTENESGQVILSSQYQTRHPSFAGKGRGGSTKRGHASYNQRGGVRSGEQRFIQAQNQK